MCGKFTGRCVARQADLLNTSWHQPPWPLFRGRSSSAVAAVKDHAGPPCEMDTSTLACRAAIMNDAFASWTGRARRC